MISLSLPLVIEAGNWLNLLPNYQEICEKSAFTTLRHIIKDEDILSRSEISIVLTDDEKITKINTHYRNQKKATNVLSFAAYDHDSIPQFGPILWGDVLIALEISYQESLDHNKAFDHHITHLMTHGVLHLLGYDHETEDEAEIMENLEREILKSLNYSDPYLNYGTRDQ
jgi:probable rRNA maturation factor